MLMCVIYSPTMKHIKDFDKWNKEKKKTNQEISRKVRFQEKEIWWCKIGINVGCEMDGKGNRFVRPVLIVKKTSPNTFFGVPLTKKPLGIVENKKLEKFYYKMGTIEKDGIIYDNVLALEQGRLFDKKRLVHKYKELNKSNFNLVLKNIKDLF